MYNLSEIQQITIKTANGLVHELKDHRDSEIMIAYTKRRISDINRKRRETNQQDIKLNDIYKILGESYTCFWGLKDD